MPLTDLRELGYDVFMPDPEQVLPTGPSVYGYSRNWNLPYNWTPEDEERVVVEATNHKNLSEKLVEAQTYFSNNYKNWPNMSNAQKDSAMRQSQRALTNLIRHVRGDLSSEGD